MLSIVYFGVVLALSSMKLLWLDELITLHVAQLPTSMAIWNALALGVDPNPPVTHLLVHISRAVLGDHEFAYRLPAMIGYWIGVFALFEYLRKRVPAKWAFAGTITSMCMGAFEYSYESRSYGIFYGLAMLAFLCWTRAVDTERSGSSRIIALFGMTLALAGGISTNYFAVLALFPIAIGESIRMIASLRGVKRNWSGMKSPLRAIELRVWIALAVAGSTLLAYRPLISRAIARFAPYAWNKVSLGQVADSYTEMVEIILYPILALFVFAAGAQFAVLHFARPISRSADVPDERRSNQQLAPSSFVLPLHEAAGVLGFMLYPILGYVLASFRGGMLSPRFVIPVCFGFAIAATAVAFRCFGTMKWSSTVLLCFVSAWFLCRETVVGYWYAQQKQSFYKVLNCLPKVLDSLPHNAPIAVPDSLLAMTFIHYAPPGVAGRVVVPLDFPAIRYYRHDDSPEENLWAGRGVLYRAKIEPVAQFESTAHNYLVIAHKNSWYLQDLTDHHFDFQHLPINTRTTDLGGFTPLARGKPDFFLASWDEPVAPRASATPLPFRAMDELPSSQGSTEMQRDKDQ